MLQYSQRIIFSTQHTLVALADYHSENLYETDERESSKNYEFFSAVFFPHSETLVAMCTYFSTFLTFLQLRYDFYENVQSVVWCGILKFSCMYIRLCLCRSVYKHSASHLL